MARSVKAIQEDIIGQVEAYFGTLSSSNTAIWRLWTYIVASAIQALEVIFDNHKTDVSATLATLKPHTRVWYKTKALAYQLGSSLPDGEDTYNNSNLTQDQVDALKIIRRAAAVELSDRLQIKVAKEVSGVPVPLDPIIEIPAFTEYMNDIKDAGVTIEIISIDPDLLKLNLDVYYDSKVLDEFGSRLDGTDATPVINALQLYLSNLPFNGVLLLSDLVDSLQKIDGIISPVVQLAQAQVLGTWYNVDAIWQTKAGYMTLELNSLSVNYIAYEL